MSIVVAVTKNRRTVLAYEFRQQPDNFHAFEADPWQDLFLAYFVNKNLALVAAYARLGSVASFASQDGWYASLQASF